MNGCLGPKVELKVNCPYCGNFTANTDYYLESEENPRVRDSIVCPNCEKMFSVKYDVGKDYAVSNIRYFKVLKLYKKLCDNSYEDRISINPEPCTGTTFEDIVIPLDIRDISIKIQDFKAKYNKEPKAIMVQIKKGSKIFGIPILFENTED